jgi:hypothetical protein
MSRSLIVIRRQADRDQASRWAQGVSVGVRIEFKEPKRTIPQNDRFWAMLTDIAVEMKKRGRDHTPDQWKVIFLAAFGHEVKFLPSLDQKTFIPLGHSSSDLSVKEMSDLMEWMTAWAAENNVPLRDNNDAASASAASEEAGADDLPASASSVPSTLINHLTDFARKGFRTLTDEDLSDDAKSSALDQMIGGYQSMTDTGDISPDDWPKFESIVTAFKAVFTGKRTAAQGREFAAEMIGCKINQIGG